MSLRLGYLTPKQRLIWRLKCEGLTEAGIGRKLSITRQTVHKALNVANQKILQAVEETAKTNKIEIQTVSPTHRYPTGYCPHFNTRAFVSYSPKNGIQICYPGEDNCTRCHRANMCGETILKEVGDREIEFEEDIGQMPPSKIGQALFSFIGGEKNE